MSKKITTKMLTDLGACHGQIVKFNELFPEGANVTIELCVKHAADFDWDWAVGAFLSRPALADYRAAVAPYLEAYKVASASALATYGATISPVRYVSDADMVHAWDKYRADVSPSSDAYESAKASAWASAYLSQK